MAKKKKRPADEYDKPGTELGTKTRSGQSVADRADASGGVSTAQRSASGDDASSTSSGSKTKGKSGPTPKAKDARNRNKSGAATTSSGGLSGNQQWMIVVGLAVLVLLGGLVWSVLRQTGGSGVTTVTAWDLPARSSDTQDGDSDRIRHSDYVGTPTVVNFFESGCAICERDLLGMVNANAVYGDQADFILVNSDQISGDWKEMVERNGALGQLPVAHDIGGSNRNGLFTALGGNPAVSGGDGESGTFSPLPATAFYNADGSLESVTFAPVSSQYMAAQLAGLGVVPAPLQQEATVDSTDSSATETDPG